MARAVEIVSLARFSDHQLTLLDGHGSLWVTCSRPWWMVWDWAWFALMPGKKAWVLLRSKDGRRTRVLAKVVSATLIWLGDAEVPE